jgi:outer membrane protein assembly factor BamB
MRNQFGPPQTIPDAVLNKLGQSAAAGPGADGNPELYFFANGAPGIFYALDAATGQRRFSAPVADARIVWAMCYSPDGNVYFAGSENGMLFRYSPSEQKIEELGVNPSGRFVWELGATADGRYLYGAVYPKGKLFEYDIAANEFRDLGSLKEGKEYVRGLGIDGDYVYAGLGTFADGEERVLVRYSRMSGEQTEIRVPSKSTFVKNVLAAGGKLFVNAGKCFVLDGQTFEALDSFAFSGLISQPSPYDENVVYYTSGRQVFRYRLDTNESEEAGLLQPLSSTIMKTLQWICPNTGEFAGKQVLAGVTSHAEAFLYDPASERSAEIGLEVDGAPVQTHLLKSGPDGKLYLGGYHSGISVYDPDSQQFLVRQFHTLQPESAGFLNGKVYFGMYTGARIFEYDPSQPWKYGAEAGSNPYQVHVIEGMDRPYVFASGDNKLFIGTIPDYGRLGGKLTVYDAERNVWTDYGNDRLIHNQSITGLAYRNGKLYASTSVRGGLGIDPSETEAKLFIWDVANECKLLERTLDLPGHKPPMIGNLAIGPDGYVWGATGSAVFALDPETLEVVKGRTLYDPALDKSGMWRPFDLLFGPDGHIYSTIGSALTVIDPETLEFEQLAPKAGVIALGKDGSVYYSFSGKDIYCLPVR